MDSAKNTVMFLDTAPWCGGAQRSLAALVVGLKRTEFQPVVVAADATRDGLLDRCGAAGIDCMRIRTRHWQRTPRGLCEFAVDALRARQTLRLAGQRWQPDLIHANGPRPALLLACGGGRAAPRVLHIRDTRIPAPVRHVTVRRAQRIIAISQTTADALASVPGATAKTRVIPNGFDIAALQTARPARACPWRSEHMTVILVADMVPWKRHLLFLRALQLAQLRMPQLRGVVVGRAVNTPAQVYMRALHQCTAALGLRHTVHYVPNATDAMPWIAAADVLVSTADLEPFGRTVVEALALGKPVVVAAGAGPEEIAGQCAAASVAGPDPHALAQAILAWREPSRRLFVADAARARAADFGIDRTVQQVAALYRELVNA